MGELYIFPDPKFGPKNSPLCSGADLSPRTLLSAYRAGIFPWFTKNKPILWWSPDPRAVLFPENIRVQKSIRSYLAKYEVKFNYNFANLIKLCKSTRKNQATWITSEIISAYIRLADLGIAHSVEVFHEDRLIGGLYGLIFGKVFCGESMISTEPNASKVALIILCKTLSEFGFLIDAQVMNPHLKFMGALNLRRDEFLQIYQNLSNQKSGFDDFGALVPKYR